MKKKELINLIITARNEIYARDGEINNDYLNICYWILKDNNDILNLNRSDFIDLIIELYDNLSINNEFITLDNINEYSTEYIKFKIGHKLEYVKNQLKNGYFYLVNYYKPYITSKFDYITVLIRPTRPIKFKHGYNILIGNEQ